MAPITRCPFLKSYKSSFSNHLIFHPLLDMLTASSSCLLSVHLEHFSPCLPISWSLLLSPAPLARSLPSLLICCHPVWSCLEIEYISACDRSYSLSKFGYFITDMKMSGFYYYALANDTTLNS